MHRNNPHPLCLLRRRGLFIYVLFHLNRQHPVVIVVKIKGGDFPHARLAGVDGVATGIDLVDEGHQHGIPLSYSPKREGTHEFPPFSHATR